MSITVNLYYKGSNGSARAFADEMETRGIADAIRAEEGNERYEYFVPLKDPETVLLIDSWRDQAALDAHHATPSNNSNKSPNTIKNQPMLSPHIVKMAIVYHQNGGSTSGEYDEKRKRGKRRGVGDT